MSDKDRRLHQLLSQTGKIRLTTEQEETISELMGDLELNLEEEGESTLELPRLRK